MDIILYSNKIDEYLKHDRVIDYDNKAIIELADTLFKRQIMSLISLEMPMNLLEIRFRIRQI